MLFKGEGNALQMAGNNIRKIMACNAVEQVMVPIGGGYREKSRLERMGRGLLYRQRTDQGSPGCEKLSKHFQSAQQMLGKLSFVNIPDIAELIGHKQKSDVKKSPQRSKKC